MWRGCFADQKNLTCENRCQAGKGRAGMMACMLLLRMGYATTATDAINCYNSERVRDHRGLTVVSQKKWVAYYAALRVQASVPRNSICAEPTITVHKLTLNNTLTATKLPRLRLRIFTLASNGLSKTLVHQEIGFHEFELCLGIRGCVMIEFRRERINGCVRAKHFKVWFNTHFLKPGGAFDVTGLSVLIGSDAVMLVFEHRNWACGVFSI